MRVLVGIIGGVMGLALGAFLPGAVYRLFVPAKGCMSAFDMIPLIPVALVAMLVGLVGGAWGANLLLSSFLTWHANQPSPRTRRQRSQWPEA